MERYKLTLASPRTRTSFFILAASEDEAWRRSATIASSFESPRAGSITLSLELRPLAAPNVLVSAQAVE